MFHVPCLVLLLFHGSHAVSPNLRSRINPSGLDFFKKAGHTFVDKEVPKIWIPEIDIPITGGPGTGDLKVDDLKIKTFRMPQFEYQLSPKGISWQSTGGMAVLSGEWRAEYTVLIPIKASGWLQANVSRIIMNVTASASALDGRPQVEVKSCEATVRRFSIEIGGSVLPWLVNLFKGPLSSVLRNVINAQACQVARNVLLEDANEFLHDLPLHFPIGSDFYVDYSLVGDPTFTTDYIQADLSADVVYKKKKPQPLLTICLDTGPDPGMLTIWVSAKVPNCLLTSAHAGGLIQLLVTKDTPQVANYLQTTCSFLSICIGKFFQKLKKDYPNQYVDLHFHSMLPPKMFFKNGLATLNVTFAVDFYINPKGNQSESLARLALNTVSSVVPYIESNRIYGTLNGTTAEVKEVFSKIGDISTTFLSMFQKVFVLTDQLLANLILKKGIPVPIYDNVTLAETSRVEIFDGYVRLNADFITVDHLFEDLWA